MNDPPTITKEQMALLERANSNLGAFCEVVAPMVGLDWLTLLKAVHAHGARKVLKAAGFRIRD